MSGKMKAAGPSMRGGGFQVYSDPDFYRGTTIFLPRLVRRPSAVVHTAKGTAISFLPVLALRFAV